MYSSDATQSLGSKWHPAVTPMYPSWNNSQLLNPSSQHQHPSPETLHAACAQQQRHDVSSMYASNNAFPQCSTGPGGPWRSLACFNCVVFTSWPELCRFCSLCISCCLDSQVLWYFLVFVLFPQQWDVEYALVYIWVCVYVCRFEWTQVCVRMYISVFDIHCVRVSVSTQIPQQSYW